MDDQSLLPPVVFVYAYGEDIVVLDFYQAKKRHDALIAEGYKHTSTLNAAMWMQSLVNRSPEERNDFINELKEVG